MTFDPSRGALILSGKARPIAGIDVTTWRDRPDLGLVLGPGGDGYAVGTRWVRAVCLHTTHGKWPQPILSGLGAPGGGAEANAAYWRRSEGQAGAHLLVDSDGTILQTCDLVTAVAYHAGSVNGVTVGIELVQRGDGGLYVGQLSAVVRLVDALTGLLGIQRQYQASYSGAPLARIAAGGRDCVGIYGHRNQTNQRGRGDPGDEVFHRLGAAGYEPVDFGRGDDLEVWRSRQASLGMAAADCDGVPGPKTVAALRGAGKPLGLRVERPGDAGLLAGA